jgi:hypothetical protein
LVASLVIWAVIGSSLQVGDEVAVEAEVALPPGAAAAFVRELLCCTQAAFQVL